MLVGDRVRVVSYEFEDSVAFMIGTEGTVIKVADAGDIAAVDIGSEVLVFKMDELEVIS